MPDTGAPWNLPYPSPTDLVRDAPQAFEDLAVATAAGLDDAGSEGIGPNVVYAGNTTQTTITSTSFVDSGLSATISLSENTSKVLVIIRHLYRLNVSTGNPVRAEITLLREAVTLQTSEIRHYQSSTTAGSIITTFTYAILDSPGTTSPQTFKTRGRCITSGNSDSIRFDEGDITLIEVKA
jgi:hypothetical protein